MLVTSNGNRPIISHNLVGQEFLPVILLFPVTNTEVTCIQLVGWSNGPQVASVTCLVLWWSEPKAGVSWACQLDCHM